MTVLPSVPRESGGPGLATLGTNAHLVVDSWIPAYAGMTVYDSVTPRIALRLPGGEGGEGGAGRLRARFLGLRRLRRGRPRPSMGHEDRSCRDDRRQEHHRLVEVQPIGADDI